MNRVSQIIVLAEDEPQQRLIRRFLQQLNYTRHEMRFESAPQGKGSGEASVRARYPLAVKVYRERATRARTSLIVAIDADKVDVARRTRQLEETLVANGLAPRTRFEKIVHLIPKRNIETWILNLNGQLVDEETDFSREPSVADRIMPAANALYNWTRPNAVVPAHCVPSLRSAIEELKRLE